MIALERLNSISAPDFVAALASIFEHSPWVPERVADVAALRQHHRLA